LVGGALFSRVFRADRIRLLTPGTLLASSALAAALSINVSWLTATGLILVFIVLDRDDDQHRHHLSPAGRTGPPSIQRQRHRTDGRLGGRPFDARVPAASLAAVLGSRRSVYDFSDAAVPLDRLGSLLGSTVGVARHVRLPDGGAPPVSAPVHIRRAEQ